VSKTNPRVPIYTLTPNPALDLSGHVANLVPNEKNYVFDQRMDPGGNGINSARIIHRLARVGTTGRSSVEVTALGFLGGSTGSEIERMLLAEGVRCRFTPISKPNRVNVTATNDADFKQTRLTFPGPKVTASERVALERQIRALRAPGIFVLGGSLPLGVPPDFHSRLARIAGRAGLEVIADVPARLLGCFEGADPLLLIKPNLAELEDWAGKKLGSEREIIRAAEGLVYVGKKTGRARSRGVASLVCVSLAERGALLLSAHGALRGIAPRVKAKGTVGAGDSMVGGFVFRLASHGIRDLKALEDTLIWGMAAGAATAESEGTSLAKAEHIAKLTRKCSVSLV
jgi:6-phosphofructokinase 2